MILKSTQETQYESPEIQSHPTFEPTEGAPADQKDKLLNALDGFGFAPPKKQPSEAKTVSVENPYYPVTVLMHD
jgi:hypothetical protein